MFDGFFDEKREDKSDNEHLDEGVNKHPQEPEDRVFVAGGELLLGHPEEEVEKMTDILFHAGYYIISSHTMVLLFRIVYILCVLLLLFVAMPIMVIIALVIGMSSGLPAFYRQRRIGKNGKQFTMYKFRTMVKGAEAMQKKYARKNEADGPVFKISDDPRFTRLGKFLSHTGLDELPQLFNVIRGEMALFGPRPLPVSEAKHLKPWMQRRHDIKPGIISPWIFEGYHSRPFDEWMRSDIAYAKKKSLWYDLGLSGKAAGFVGKLLVREITSILPISQYYQ